MKSCVLSAGREVIVAPGNTMSDHGSTIVDWQPQGRRPVACKSLQLWHLVVPRRVLAQEACKGGQTSDQSLRRCISGLRRQLERDTSHLALHADAEYGQSGWLEARV